MHELKPARFDSSPSGVIPDRGYFLCYHVWYNRVLHGKSERGGALSRKPGYPGSDVSFWFNEKKVCYLNVLAGETFP